MRNGPRPVLCLFALAVLTAVAARAQPLRPARVLSVETGLSGSFVEAVAVGAAGFLWAGTQQGLDRWDGVRLTSFEAPAGISALAPAARGGLWATGPDGTRYAPQAAHPFHRLRDADGRRGPLGAPGRTLAADARGVWIGTVAHGVVRVVAARRRYRRFGRTDGLPSDSVTALVRPRGARGEVWVGTPAGVSRLVESAGRVHATLAIGPVTACADAGGAVWCATRGGTLHELDPVTGRTRATVETGATVSALVASQARSGTLWVGTRGTGLLRLDTPSRRLAPATRGDDADPLVRADVLALAEGTDGLLWIGTTGALFRASARPPPFALGAPPPAPGVFALHEARAEPGVLWMGTQRGGTERGGLVRLDRATGARRSWFTDPDDPRNVVLAIHEDARRQLWLGTTDGSLTRFSPATGRTARVPLDARPGVVTYSVAGERARPDVLWVGTSAAGLLEVDARTGTVRRQWAPGAAGRFRLDAEVVWTSVEAPDEPGVRWLATEGLGLLRLDVPSGRLTPAPTRGGCTLDGSVFALAPGPGGALWVGRKRDGLVRYNRRTGTCRAFPPDDGRPTDARALTLDRHGRVWMTTRTGGMVVVDPARGTQARFTTDDGLPADEFYVPAHARTAAGEWLVGGPAGWVSVAPDTVSLDATPPRVVVTGLRVDGQPTPLPRSRRPLVLRPRQNDVAFEFAALSLGQPTANRYRVRLDRAGEAAEPWTVLGERPDVRFPYLAPGRYTFTVAGADARGVWAVAPPVAVTVQPPLWRRWWVRALAALFALALVAGAYQVRIRQILRLEATRRRIADDLHDDIGSKVSTVALRLDLAGRSRTLGPDERQRLVELADTARGVVADLRDAVWVVDAGHDSLAALVDRVELAAAQMLAGRPHSVERPATLPDVTLSMDRRRHLFLWVREALHNASRHGAGHIRVRVALSAGTLDVAVEDEGPGFDPDAVRNGRGRGMTTLCDRAHALGGSCDIESAPGRGTRVRLRVPMRASRRPGARRIP